MIASKIVKKIKAEILCFCCLANHMNGHSTVICWYLVEFACIEDGPKPEEMVDSGYCKEFEPGTPGLSASEASLARILHENADNGVYFIKSVSESICSIGPMIIKQWA